MIKSLELLGDNNLSLDLINTFRVEKDDLAFEWANTNEVIAQEQRLVSGRGNTLPERTLANLTTRLLTSEWEAMRTIFTRDQKYLRLIYDNGINKYVVYIDDVPKVSYKPIAATDFVDISVSLTQLSNLFLVRNYNKVYRDNLDDVDYGTYPIKYGDFKYAPRFDTSEDNYIGVENDGDTNAPWVLIVPEGGLNPTITFTQAGESQTLSLLGDYRGKLLVFNMWEMVITANGFDVTDNLDSDYQNWFYLKLGKTSVNATNIKDYTVQVMNVRRTP